MNECKLVEDLLPLYAEELISEESAEFIREHCADCEHCSKLLERTAQPVQKLPEDPEAMKRALRSSSIKMVVRGLAYFLLITGLAVGGFFYWAWEAGFAPVEQVFLSDDGLSKVEIVDWDHAGFFNTGTGVIVKAEVSERVYYEDREVRHTSGYTGCKNWENVDGAWSPDARSFLATVDLTSGGKGMFLFTGRDDSPMGWWGGTEAQGLITVLTGSCREHPAFPTGWESITFTFHAWGDDSETLTFIYETDNGHRGFVDYHYPTDTITAVD